MNWLRRLIYQWLIGVHRNESIPVPRYGALSTHVGSSTAPSPYQHTTVYIQKVENGMILTMEYEDHRGRTDRMIRLVHDGGDVIESIRSMLVLRVML